MENFMTVVFDCSQNSENQLLKPKDIKTLSGTWNETKNSELVLLAADVSPSMSVLIDRYKHRLRI